MKILLNCVRLEDVARAVVDVQPEEVVLPLLVLAGLEIIRTLNETGIKTRHPIEVVNWTNEEGTRFSPPMMASGVFAGVHTLDWAYGRTDAAGKTVGGELERIGWIGDEEVGARKLAAFFELHIEQGPILEDESIDIGVVTHGQGLNCCLLYTSPSPRDS